MKKRTIGILVGAFLLIGGVVWAWPRTDPQLQKVEQLQREMFDENLPRDQRGEKWRQFHDEMHKLTDAQRDALWDKMSEHMGHFMEKRIAGYFAVPPDQRTAYLDKQIQEDKDRHKERQAQRPQDGQQQGPRKAAAEIELPTNEWRSANKWLDRSTPEQRAQWTAYRAAMQQRRIQLGLPPWPGRGRGPGR